MRTPIAHVAIRIAPGGGLKAGTWNTLGLAIWVQEYQARKPPRKNRTAAVAEHHQFAHAGADGLPYTVGGRRGVSSELPEGQWTERERERRMPRNDVTTGPAGASAGARGFGNIPPKIGPFCWKHWQT